MKAAGAPNEVYGQVVQNKLSPLSRNTWMNAGSKRRKMTALDISMFESVSPSRFITFNIPNPLYSPHPLRISVIDSPILPTTTTTTSTPTAAMLVPKNRESDWIFSTESGHLQLLLSLPITIQRLILIAQHPVNASDSPQIYHRTIENQERLEMSLKPLVRSLSPTSFLKYGNFDVPFLSYEDNLVSSVLLEKCVGSFVGEMLVEDVEIEIDTEKGSKTEFRRRLRFKRMPNLVQTDVRIIPVRGCGEGCVELGEIMEFTLDLSVLVHPYLAPMVASLALVGSHVEECVRIGRRPKALCIGVGGGALLSFLKDQLGFEVAGVELDREVLMVARQYFGLEEDGEFVHLHVGDGIEFLERLSRRAVEEEDHGKYGDAKFDVVMVDLDSSDVMNGVTAPPLEFVRKNVLLAARMVLQRSGVLVVNVIPPCRTFYDRLIDQFREVFKELYEIDVGNGENFVLIAMVVPVRLSIEDCEASFATKLRSVIPEKYIDSIKLVSSSYHSEWSIPTVLTGKRRKKKKKKPMYDLA